MQPTRRDVLRNLTFGAIALQTPGLFAEVLTETARMGEGPFYPDKLPLDTDNDLLIINNSITPSVGEITHVSGRALSASGILTTQMMIKGHEANSRDFVLAAMRDKSSLDTILVDFRPMAGSTLGELTATFDIVLGKLAL